MAWMPLPTASHCASVMSVEAITGGESIRTTVAQVPSEGTTQPIIRANFSGGRLIKQFRDKINKRK